LEGLLVKLLLPKLSCVNSRVPPKEVKRSG
jgi:hypothetical protein